MSQQTEQGGVLVVGAGPVGLTMAAELARHGVRCRVIDRLEKPSPYCRAIGVSPRTLEVYDDMGIAREMIDAGIWLRGMRTIMNGRVRDTLRDLSDQTYAVLGVAQYDTERVLARHLSTFGVEVERGVGLEGVEQNGEEAIAVLNRWEGDRWKEQFAYVIGCDGAHSVVRRAVGIEFPGQSVPVEFILGDVEVEWDVPPGLSVRAIRPKEQGPPDIFVAIPLAEERRYRVSMLAPAELAEQGGSDHGIQSERAAPGLEHLQAVAGELVPGKVMLRDLRWASIFRISVRLADRYRVGNVIIAGDAAHIHPPTGGQGMNTGIQDAYNLAWKLALVVRGKAHAGLLDSYELERRAVGQEVLESTVRASVNFGKETGPVSRLADTQLLVSYRGSAWVCGDSSGRWEIAAGDRAPDCGGLRRAGIGYPIRLFDIIRGAFHVLVVYCTEEGEKGALPELRSYLAERGLADLVQTAIVVSERAAGGFDVLPTYSDVAGEFGARYGDSPTAFLVRPDGYLAWRGESWRDGELDRYLDRVFVKST